MDKHSNGGAIGALGEGIDNWVKAGNLLLLWSFFMLYLIERQGGGGGWGDWCQGGQGGGSRWTPHVTWAFPNCGTSYSPSTGGQDSPHDLTFSLSLPISGNVYVSGNALLLSSSSYIALYNLGFWEFTNGFYYRFPSIHPSIIFVDHCSLYECYSSKLIYLCIQIYMCVCVYVWKVLD